MKKTLIIFLIALAASWSCKTVQEEETGIRVKKNFILVAYDADIEDPSSDRRSYYRVFIDKIDSGRTTTGLESQKKYFEAELSDNKHLIKVEKWVLDEKKGRYIKLNNIEQPKPDYIYVTTTEKKVTKIFLKSTKYGNAVYSKE